MAPSPPVHPKRAGDAAQDRLALLKELAKLSKPTGPSAKGRSAEGDEDE